MKETTHSCYLFVHYNISCNQLFDNIISTYIHTFLHNVLKITTCYSVHYGKGTTNNAFFYTFSNVVFLLLLEKLTIFYRPNTELLLIS